MAEHVPTPVKILKRKRSDDSSAIDFSRCVLCQEDTKENVHQSGEDGKKRVQEAARERVRLFDRDSILVLNRLEGMSPEDWESVQWHRNCYTNFASKGRLERLRKKVAREQRETSVTGGTRDDDSLTADRLQVPERKLQPTDWSKCIFCQDVNEKEIHNIMTLRLSSRIIDLSKGDITMCTRTANVVDLIAAEGKYHRHCLTKFERKMKKKDSDITIQTDATLHELSLSLLSGLSLGSVYDMGDVWDMYLQLAKENQTSVPDCYLSRRQSFYSSLQEYLGDEASFVRPLDPKSHLLLYPSDKSKFIIAQHLAQVENPPTTTSPSDHTSSSVPSTIMQEIVHSALHLRRDLADKPGHTSGWRDITHKAVAAIVPESLFVFLSVLFGGTNVLEALDNEEETAETTEREEVSTDQPNRILNVAQDIIFAVSKGRKLTPKHVGLGMTLHQATRSENLVDLFHSSGDSIGMDTIRRIDTSIANNILARYEENGNVFIPDCLVPFEPGRIILGSADNIDVIEDTISGEGTFHCTQWVAWQRGPAPARPAGVLTYGRDRTVKKDLVEVLHETDLARLPVGCRAKPLFNDPSQIGVARWFDQQSKDRSEAKTLNDTWIMARTSTDTDQDVPPWAMFNEIISTTDPPVTSIGMAPILNAPADTYSTITTLMNRFILLTSHLRQKHTVLFLDQPLYSKAKEVAWSSPEKYGNVVIMMGGLHIAFNFLRAIGQQMENSGLEDIWVESEQFGPQAINSMVDGKNYYRAFRGHLWAYEALCRIKCEMFLTWLSHRDPDLHRNIEAGKLRIVQQFQKQGYQTHNEEINDAVTAFQDMLKTPQFQEVHSQFESELKGHPTQEFWLNYINMVEILLDFTRASRDGNWKLHLDAFSAMLPWLAVYDHTNYTRWGPVYLSDMKELPQTCPEVHSEFLMGNFVIKKHVGRFNQVPVDQGTEWVNKICKLSNGIIGITKQDTARDKFCTTWTERSEISEQTKRLFGLGDELADVSFSTRKDYLTSRRDQDEDAICKIKYLFERFKVFHLDNTTNQAGSNVQTTKELVSLTTNDVATVDITESLLSAEEKGKALVVENVEQRLVNGDVPFFEKLKRQSRPTFATLYKVPGVKKEREKVKDMKADRHLIHRLLNASRAGRDVDLAEILEHELSNVPLSIAEANKKMKTTSKSALLSILTEGINVNHVPESPAKTCYLIDGHALVQTLGKPQKCLTFDDYAKTYAKSVIGHFSSNVSRVDVVFDRYLALSIKSGTREKRAGKTKPIRKVVNRGDLGLPKVWKNFLALNENKEDMANFLSDQLVAYGNAEKEIVVGGSERGSFSSARGQLRTLEGNHEEADTRLILHALEAIRCGYDRIVVQCRDTDVLLLLLYFLGDQPDIWMKSGTGKDPKFYPVHDIAKQLSPTAIQNILGFHSISGCDTVSSFGGLGKKTCWKVYLQYPELLHGVGRDGTPTDVEQFVCRVYKAPDVFKGCNIARLELFQKGKKALDMLPPTSDALELHIKRANFQAKVWMQADTAMMDLADPTSTGAWKEVNGELEKVWTRKPSIPQSCRALVSCGCKTKCRTTACQCHSSKQGCMPSCSCEAHDCLNIYN